MQTQIEQLITQVNGIYESFYPDTGKAVAHLNAQEMILTDRQNYSDVELQEKLQYYNNWSLYYSSQIERWKFIEEWIKTEQDRLTSKALAERTDKYKYQTEAKLADVMAPFTRAILIAAGKKSQAFTNRAAADGQRDVIQNMIRLRIAERRQTQP